MIRTVARQSDFNTADDVDHTVRHGAVNEDLRDFFLPRKAPPTPDPVADVQYEEEAPPSYHKEAIEPSHELPDTEDHPKDLPTLVEEEEHQVAPEGIPECKPIVAPLPPMRTVETSVKPAPKEKKLGWWARTFKSSKNSSKRATAKVAPTMPAPRPLPIPAADPEGARFTQKHDMDSAQGEKAEGPCAEDGAVWPPRSFGDDDGEAGGSEAEAAVEHHGEHHAPEGDHQLAPEGEHVHHESAGAEGKGTEVDSGSLDAELDAIDTKLDTGNILVTAPHIQAPAAAHHDEHEEGSYYSPSPSAVHGNETHAAHHDLE